MYVAGRLLGRGGGGGTAAATVVKCWSGGFVGSENPAAVAICFGICGSVRGSVGHDIAIPVVRHAVGCAIGEGNPGEVIGGEGTLSPGRVGIRGGVAQLVRA